MSAFRGSDDDLEREIATVERLVRVRLRRSIGDLRELETTLTELRRERRRRQRAAAGTIEVEGSVTASMEP